MFQALQGVVFQADKKKRKQKQNKRKAKKARAKRMEVNYKSVIETIAPQQESHDVTEPIGPLSLHYEGISGLLKTQRPYIQYAFEKGLFTNESQEIIKQYLRFNLSENHDDDESDCINADDMIKMLTPALMVMLKTVMKRIAKTLIALLTTLFIIKMQ